MLIKKYSQVVYSVIVDGAIKIFIYIPTEKDFFF